MKKIILVLMIAAVVPFRSAAAPARRAARAIVIIPGITATELQIDGRTVWPPDLVDASIKDFSDLLARVARAVEDMKLLACDGQGNPIHKAVPLRMTPAAPPATGRLGMDDFYGVLAKALQSAFGKESVYFFGYDWRLDNERSAAELEVFIRQVRKETGAAKVDIVAHSMGGIVASAYLGRHGAKDSVDRVVFLGTPFLGAADAFRVLSGESADWLPYMPKRIQTLGERETTSVHQLLEGMERTIIGLSRTYPSVYQLLPAPERKLLSRLDGPAASLGASAQARMGSAFALDMALRLPEALSGVQVRNVVGTGFPTAQAAEPSPDGLRILKGDGDGIVPLQSALAGGMLARCTRRFPVKHEALAADRRCVDFIIAELSRP
jgi:hypothetical protein